MSLWRFFPTWRSSKSPLVVGSAQWKPVSESYRHNDDGEAVWNSLTVKLWEHISFHYHKHTKYCKSVFCERSSSCSCFLPYSFPHWVKKECNWFILSRWMGFMGAKMVNHLSVCICYTYLRRHLYCVLSFIRGWSPGSKNKAQPLQVTMQVCTL